MDTDMTDVAYDIDIDVGSVPIAAPQPEILYEESSAQKDVNEIPAAYTEDLNTQPSRSSHSLKPWPESLNLQGVKDFDPNDPTYYAMDKLGAEPRVKQLRWVNDDSVNLEFYSPEDAVIALARFTDPSVLNASSLSPQESRKAKPFNQKPNSILIIRETNSGDQKPRGAAKNSGYYQRNPDVAGNRQREPPRRQQPPRDDFLDYGSEETAPRNNRRRSSGDESMSDGSGGDRRRNNRHNDRDIRDNRGRGRGGRGDRGGRFRDDRDSGRLRDDRDSGRLNADTDSYRPGSRSPRESRVGRLRGRSASPADEEGDGRFGFAEDSSNLRTRYRSRSRSRNARRRQEPSGERWTHDKYGTTTTGGRWQKDAPIDSSPMGNHRRSDAVDGGKGGSLLARMTKDGRPVLPQTRSLADRITRVDDGADYGRLKDDDSEPRYSDFSETKPRRNLIDRISRDTEINIRGRSQEGINIRGSASNGSAGGINIRGVASGA